MLNSVAGPYGLLRSKPSSWNLRPESSKGGTFIPARLLLFGRRPICFSRSRPYISIFDMGFDVARKWLTRNGPFAENSRGMPYFGGKIKFL